MSHLKEIHGVRLELLYDKSKITVCYFDTFRKNGFNLQISSTLTKGFVAFLTMTNIIGTVLSSLAAGVHRGQQFYKEEENMR